MAICCFPSSLLVTSFAQRLNDLSYKKYKKHNQVLALLKRYAGEMAALPRVPTGPPLKKQHSMRPPISRPTSSRTQSNAPSLNARLQAGTVSPVDSLASASTINSRMMNSRSGSPTSRQAGGKRKERDYDGDEEETNIHVVVRCRGRNDREVRENSGVVVSTNGVKGNNVELSMGPNALSNKTYNFDKVFSPAADQTMIFDDVVTPILDQVRGREVRLIPCSETNPFRQMLQGYNCTIFAYGQTGTGKGPSIYFAI